MSALPARFARCTGAWTRLAKGWRGAGAPGGAERLASTDGGAQRQDPGACTGVLVGREQQALGVHDGA